MIEMWADGSSEGKVGCGGWAYLVNENGKVRWQSGGEKDGATNSRMEMLAVILGLESLPPNSKMKVYCDSSMVVNGIKRGWVTGWRMKAIDDVWLNSRKEPVKNRDLWERLTEAVLRHKSVNIVHVKGHTGSSTRAAMGNRRVDSLAHNACQKMKKLRKERGS